MMMMRERTEKSVGRISAEVAKRYLLRCQVGLGVRQKGLDWRKKSGTRETSQHSGLGRRQWFAKSWMKKRSGRMREAYGNILIYRKCFIKTVVRVQ